jgi:hypothetical protein
VLKVRFFVHVSVENRVPNADVTMQGLNRWARLARLDSMQTIIAAALVLLGAVGAQAQATATVPPTDPVYRVLRSFVAAGLLDTIVMSALPMSRRDIDRALAEADARASDPATRALIAGYRGDGATSGSRARFDELRFEATLVDSPARDIDGDGNGDIDVALNPILGYREGRRYQSAATAAVEAQGTARLAPWLVGVSRVRGRFGMDRGGSASTSAAGELQQLYLRAVVRNVAITAGRDYTAWGHGDTPGLIGSANARALDMLRLTSDGPLVLPSVLRYLGPLQFTGYIADLGPNQNFPHAKLVGYKLAGRPFSLFEFGAHGVTHIGGTGAPRLDAWDWIAQTVPLLDQVGVHESRQLSNRFFGADLSVPIPKAAGLELMWQFVVDDMDFRRFRSGMTEDAGHMWGASVNCLIACGLLRVSAEYHKTGVRYYTHGLYTSGLTVDGNIIGNGLGPRAKGAYLRFDYERPSGTMALHLAHEERSGNRYTSATTGPNDDGFHFVLTDPAPSERRVRATARWTRGHPTTGLLVRADGGVERVEHFGFVHGRWRTNGLAQVTLEWRP